jgi:hypothetical protein
LGGADGHSFHQEHGQGQKENKIEDDIGFQAV